MKLIEKLRNEMKESNIRLKKRLLNAEKNRLKTIAEEKIIKPNISVADSINTYLKDIKEEITENSPKISDDEAKTLFYTKMKRFIFTAYNNLYEMDSGFFDDKLKKLKRELLALEELLNSVHSRLVNREIAYEKIFLSEQDDYILVESFLDINKTHLSAMIANEKSLRRQLDYKEKVLKEEKEGTKAYKKALDELKTVKRHYADLTFELHSLKEQTKSLIDLKNSFKDRYLKEFSESLKVKLEKLEKLLVDILNHKAYELDYDLWAKARESEAIRQFFKVSKIDGGFSSKTYLKYFLKNLDDTKTSELQQELKDILKYLQDISERNILIVSQTESMAEEYKYLIEVLDKDFVVKVFTRPFSALTYAHQVKFDLIILDYFMLDMDAFEFLHDFKEELPRLATKTNFIIFVENINKSMINSFNQIDMHPIFLSKDISEDNFILKVREILK